MASISKQVIEDRVERFVECVRSSTHADGFELNKHWWITHKNKSNEQNHPNAFTFVEQIGVSNETMTKHYGRYWVRTIGDSLLTSYFRQRNLGQAVCVTVIPADSNKKTENSTPSLENIVGGVFHSTRNSKSPWENNHGEVGIGVAGG